LGFIARLLRGALAARRIDICAQAAGGAASVKATAAARIGVTARIFHLLPESRRFGRT